AVERRVLGVPLVPCDGARVVRGPRGGGRDERPVRQHQGRPRGTARRRQHLHGGRAGPDRPRRLADDGVPDAGQAAVLRRHLLPEGAAARSVLDVAVSSLRSQYDSEWGGFGQAPKFPQESSLELLLRAAAQGGRPEILAMVTETLDAMASGGIYDQ